MSHQAPLLPQWEAVKRSVEKELLSNGFRIHHERFHGRQYMTWITVAMEASTAASIIREKTLLTMAGILYCRQHGKDEAAKTEPATLAERISALVPTVDPLDASLRVMEIEADAHEPWIIHMRVELIV